MNTDTRPITNSGNSNRKIIFHYHLFKNAGTSLDESFRSTLDASQWATSEFDSDIELNRIGVKQWIESNTEVVCFSSHTALLPPPVMENIDILPLIFVRHPIDRIASVYAFECKQDIDSYGSKLAKSSSFSEYVLTRINRKNDHQCNNFHAYRLASMSSNDKLNFEDSALDAIDSLDVVGLVDAFPESIEVFNRKIHDFGLGKVVLDSRHKNATRSVKIPMEERLEQIRRDLGSALFDRLLEVNYIDMRIYEKVAKRYEL